MVAAAARPNIVVQIPPALQAAINANNGHLQAQVALLQQFVNQHAPPPAPAAPVENQLIIVLKLEAIPQHLHVHIPVSCSWKKKINQMEPGFWLIVAILKPVALVRADLTKDMDLPGDFLNSFILGLNMHFPSLDNVRKNLLIDYFKSLMNYYLLHLPEVTRLLAALPVNNAAVRAVAEQLVNDCMPTLKLARAIMIELDTEHITSLHGQQSGQMYKAMTHELNGDAHLGDAAALKQVTYHSTIHKASARLVTNAEGSESALQGKSRQCRRCKQSVPFGGFAAHNKPGICPGRGVPKPGGKISGKK